MSRTQAICRSSLAVMVLPALLSAMTAYGQGNGIPEDWSHHHVVFSSPGSFDDAMRNGKVGEWSKIVNEPRFQIQQLRRSLQQNRDMGFGHAHGSLLKTDWSMDMGATATVGAGQYPAKWTLLTYSASCSDWVAYNTGTAGVSGGQANIVAYSNIYDNTTCTGLGSVPTVHFAYFSGTGKALTSPIISGDGTKIAYIENPTTGAAVLRIMEWVSGQGTPTAAHTPDHAYTNTNAGSVANKAWNTTNCPTGASCMISVAFQDGHQDTNSAPFYVYYNTNADTLFVGDNSGDLHQFTGVFNGTPGEVTTNWPVAVSTNALTSPVYDTGTSGNIFVADWGSTSSGFLYAVNFTLHAKQWTSSRLTNATDVTGIVDGPLLDSTAEMAYVFVGIDANDTAGDACANANGCGGVFQFPATNSGTGSGVCNATSITAWSGSLCGEEAVFGQGTTTTPTTYDGAFDQLYYATTAGTAGNLWTCNQHAASEPRLSYVPINTNGKFVASGSDIYVLATTAVTTLTNSTASCSPLTEIYGSNGTTNDYVFAGVTANGSVATLNTSPTCTGGCVYNFLVGTGGALSVPTEATEAIQATNGSSGIVIDNALGGTGESQIYYAPLGAMPCTGGTGGCAVQTSQSAP